MVFGQAQVIAITAYRFTSLKKQTEKNRKKTKTWALDRPKSLLSQLTGLHLKKSKQKKNKQKKHGLWTGPSHCYHSLQVYILKKANRKKNKKNMVFGQAQVIAITAYRFTSLKKQTEKNRKKQKNMVFGQAQVIAITAYRFTS